MKSRPIGHRPAALLVMGVIAIVVGSANVGAITSSNEEPTHPALSVQAAAPPCGDLNGDSTVNVFDAITLLQIIVGIVTPDATQSARADLDQNESVNVFDAITLLQIIVGLIPPGSVVCGAVTTPPVIDLLAASDSGVSDADDVTGDNTPTLSVTANAGVFVQLFVDAALVGQATTSASGVAEFTTGVLTDGTHTFTADSREAGNSITSQPLNVVVDTASPVIAIVAPAEGGQVVPVTRLVGFFDGTGSDRQSVTYQFDALGEISLNFGVDAGAFSQTVDLAGISAGAHLMTITATDLAGNQAVVAVNIIVSLEMPFAVTALLPLSGAVDVGVTFKPQVFFSVPVDPATLNGANFFAEAGGQVLSATIVPAINGLFAWLFFTDPMPSSAIVEVTVDGTTITSAGGGAFLDADGDGQPGGVLTYSFSTVSVEPLPNTTLTGMIVDPGPDTEPMTDDDFSAGADGIPNTDDDVFLLPIAGATVSLIGVPGSVFTNANGEFLLDPVPGGEVKLEVNGMTATAPPLGFYFPEMVIAVDVQPGTENFPMPGMRHMYLPRVPTAILNDVTASVGAMIVADDISAPGLTPADRGFLTLEIQPNSLIGPNGESLTGVQQIGISTVPPELVMDMLPPGVLKHTFDITVQAPGISNFSDPAPMTFPNVFGAAPGTKLNFLSFDHTTGLLVIEGTATVSADGLSVSTDPDTGVTHPGWHGLTPPGTETETPCDPNAVHDVMVDPDPLTVNLNDYFFKDDFGGFILIFGNSAQKIDPTKDPCDPANIKATPLVVEIRVDGSPDEFLSGLSDQTFELQPGQQQVVAVQATDLIPGIKAVEKDRFYGVKITIKGWKDGEPGNLLINEEIYVFRFLDAADSDHADGVVEMADTTSDVATVQRLRPVEFIGVQPDLSVADSTHFDFLVSDFFSDPVATQQDLTTTLRVNKPGGGEVGTLQMRGDGDRLEWWVDAAQFLQVLQDLSDGTLAGASAAERALIDTAAERQSVVNNVIASTEALMSAFNAGWTRVANATAGSVDINNLSKGSLCAPGTSCTLGSAFIVDNKANGGAKAVVAGRTSWSKAEQNFRISETLNEQAPGHVDVYIDRYFALRNFAAGIGGLENALAKTFAHEIGHNIGLNHTSNSSGTKIIKDGSGNPAAGAQSDVMAQGMDSAGTRTFNLTANAFRVATGLAWTVAQAQQAIDYFAAYVGGGGDFDTAEYDSDAIQYLERFAAGGDNHAGGEDPYYLDRELGIKCDGLRVFIDDEGRGPLAIGDEDSEGVASVDAEGPDGDPDVGAGPLINDGVLHVVTDPELEFTVDLDLGSVSVDGVGGSSVTQALAAINVGDQDLVIGGFSIVPGGSPDLVVSSLIPAGTVLAPGETAGFSVTFDPTTSGEHTSQIIIDSDGIDPVYELNISGFGFSPDGDIRLEVANNNVGGQAVGAGALTATDFATLKNIGASPLTITDIIFSEGIDVYGVAGPTLPLVLQPGESTAFHVLFDPNATGLLPGAFQVLSDDPESPSVSQRMVGTGLADTGTALDYGNDFVALETPFLEGSPVLRTVSDDDGNWQLFLPPDEPYHYAIFDPFSGLVAHGFGITAGSGEPTPITAPVFLASDEADTDGDGLPDDAEFAIGTNPGNPDTDGDGLQDGFEIQQGLDPFGGLAFPTGIIASLALQGEAMEVVVESIDGTDQIAYVATGSDGISIVDVTQFDDPILLARLALPGDNADVAVDTRRNIAAVTGGSDGLHLVDVSDPLAPALLRTVALLNGAARVEVFDGLAYVASGSQVVSVDLTSGDLLQTLELGGIMDLAREGTTLFVMAGGNLRAVRILDFEMEIGGFLTLPPNNGGGRLFVGNGIAYATAVANVQGGFATVDVSDPDNLALISGADVPSTNQSPKTDIVANGSGLALLVGTIGATPMADLMNVADPSDTFSLLTRFVLPVPPHDVHIAGGIAFIAAGTAGLQVLNYLSFDNQGLPPQVTLNSGVEDQDPLTPGVQVVEGTSVPVQVGVTDDFQVRRVDLLIDGELVETDISFPFDFFGIALGADPDAPTVSLRARAFDSGGNVSLSNELVLDLVQDTSPPTIESFTPPDGGEADEGLRSVSVHFNEPIASDSATAASFQLRDAGDTVINPLSVELRNGERTVFLTYTQLPAGVYSLTINSASVADRAGNPLGVADITSQFTVIAATILWIGGSGLWDDVTHWNTGVLPGPADRVLIASDQGDITVTHSTGATSITRLLSENRLVLSGGSFTVSGTVRVNNDFILDGATLASATVLPGAAGQKLVALFNGNNRLDGVTLEGELALDGGKVRIANGLTVNGLVRMSGASMKFEGTQTLGGTGTVLFEGLTDNRLDAFSTATLTIGSDLTIRGSQGVIGGVFSQPMSVVNQGTILAEVAFRTIRVEARNGSFSNQGTIQADAGGILDADRLSGDVGTALITSSGRLDLDGTYTINQNVVVPDGGRLTLRGDWNNSAVINATNATVNLGGTFTLVDLGTFNRNGGTVNIIGTLDNTGTTLALNATSGSWRINGGTILGGNITTTDGAKLVARTNSNSRLDGVTLDGELELALFGARVRISNGLTVNGLVRMSGKSSLLEFEGSQILGGTGTVLFDLTFGGFPELEALGGATLTIGPDLTIRGGHGEIGAGRQTMSLVNQGTILSEEGGIIRMEAFGGTFSNQGTLQADAGGTLELHDLTSNQGSILAGAGSLVKVFGFLTQASTGVISAEISGTSTAQFGRITVTGAANLAGTLNINLAGFEPSLNDSFQVMTYASRNGEFATVNGLDIGNGKLFQVNYSPTGLTLTVVETP